ncbi:MAG: mycothiol system anti-sigma-R factor [Acidimicrobiales bacterium]
MTRRPEMGRKENQEELDCREALHRIYHFLDGEMTSERRAQIETHLNGCSPCLEAFGFEAELRKIVACKCQETAPDTLRERIAEAIHHEHDRAAT